MQGAGGKEVGVRLFYPTFSLSFLSALSNQSHLHQAAINGRWLVGAEQMTVYDSRVGCFSEQGNENGAKKKGKSVDYMAHPGQ